MSSKAIPNAGTYAAKSPGAIVLYETEKGALCAAIPVQLLGSEVAWQGKHIATLVKQDGTLQTKTIDNLKKIFGWDGIDPFALMDLDISAVEFEVVGDHEQYMPPGDNQEERTVFKIQWINPVGGGMNMPTPVTDDERKSLLAKYGSKFKAHSGGARAASSPAKAASTPAAKKDAPTAKPAVSGPPSRGKGGSPAVGGQDRTSSQQEVWDDLVKANPKKAEDELADLFYGAQDKVRADANGELEPAEWGKVLDELGL